MVLTISSFIVEKGTFVLACFAKMAFLIRFNKSAIGSVTTMILLLPARLNDSWEFPSESQCPETDSTHLELSQVCPGSAAQSATVVFSDLKFWFPIGLGN